MGILEKEIRKFEDTEFVVGHIVYTNGLFDGEGRLHIIKGEPPHVVYGKLIRRLDKDEKLTKEETEEGYKVIEHIGSAAYMTQIYRAVVSPAPKDLEEILVDFWRNDVYLSNIRANMTAAVKKHDSGEQMPSELEDTLEKYEKLKEVHAELVSSVNHIIDEVYKRK